MASAEGLSPHGEKRNGYDASRKRHCNGIQDNMSLSSHRTMGQERKGESCHSDAHYPLNGQARCKPLVGKISDQSEENADRENGVILRPVKAMLFQYGLIAQRDPWIHGSVANSGAKMSQI